MDSPTVIRGTCHALFAFEVGQSVDLSACERLISTATARQTLKQSRRAPPNFQYRPAPLRVTQSADPVKVGRCQTKPQLEAVLYDFGAILVSFAIPIEGPLTNLLELSSLLHGHQALLEAARTQVKSLVTAVAGAITRPRIAEMVEDYAIFHVEALEPAPSANELQAGHAQLFARILRAETVTLSDQEVADALAFRLSFGMRDVTIVDWNAALVFDAEADETRTVLEFANVQLLEMRFLDQELDEDLEHSYQVLSSRGLRRWRPFRSQTGDLVHLSTLQADAAVLFERVGNALKLVGDMYLARLYRMVSQRFHLEEWDTNISRKLQTIEGIYQKLADRQESQRIEALEWIVIILIAVEIGLSLLHVQR